MDVPETRYAKTVDGLHIAYQVAGSGPFDLVYMTSFISNVECVWDVPDQGDFLRRLAGLSRLVVFDRRGAGLSDWPPTTESLALELSVADVGAVMDAAGSQRAVLFGWEEGGTLAALFAASYPERVAALVLFAAWAKYSASPDYPWGWTEEQSDEWSEWIERAWGTEEFWRSNMDYVSQHVARDLERVRAWARYARLSVSPGAAHAIERMSTAIDVRAVLPAIRVPALVMHRVGDPYERFEQARYIAERIPGARLVELPGDEHAPFMGDTAAVLDEVQRFVSSIHAEEAEFDRVLATVLFTDIVDSTRRIAALGDRAWRELVERHHATVRALLARYRGTEVDTAGDGFFATFDGPARAVRCARAIVEAVAALGLEVRTGVHTGEVETIGDKVGGIAVSIGARVGALAGPSETLVSSTVKDLTAGSGLVFEDGGEHDLKGIAERWRLYRVVTA